MIKALTLVLLFSCTLNLCFSQSQKLHVVTKKIEKTFPYKLGYELNLEGEKAEVDVESWEKNEIKIILELIVKHTDKSIAEKDLQLVQHQVEKVKDNIYLRNYISTGTGAPLPQSLISAKYIVKVPATCPVYVKNNYGLASLRNLHNQLRIFAKFTEIGLNNISGKMDVNTRFGALVGQQLDGNMTLQSRRSDITLSDIKGSYDIRAQYSNIEIFTASELVNLIIDAEKSDIRLHSPDPQIFSFDIIAENAGLKLPSDMVFAFSEGVNAGIKKASFKPDQEYFANLTIRISFGNLIVEK